MLQPAHGQASPLFPFDVLPVLSVSNACRRLIKAELGPLARLQSPFSRSQLPPSSFLHLTKDSSALTVSLIRSRSRVTPCLRALVREIKTRSFLDEAVQLNPLDWRLLRLPPLWLSQFVCFEVVQTSLPFVP